jgi:hypothetical protein
MYTIDERDCVVKIEEFPQSSIGAPIPIVISNEFVTVVAFYLKDTPDDWDGTTVREITMETEGRPIALVRFSRCHSLMFGPPDDEAFDGHPLANRGLMPYGAFLIENSSWLRQLEKMNSVHPYHSPERFNQLKHYVLTFHDSTFECVAEYYSVEVHKESMRNAIPRMIDLLSHNMSVDNGSPK